MALLAMSLVLPASQGVAQTNVDIDIRPGDDSNTIRLQSNGVVPVAILSNNGFDATTVVAATVSFEGALDKNGHGGIEDVNGDGLADMILHFETQDTGITPADTIACLTATTTSGETFQGCDPITVT